MSNKTMMRADKQLLKEIASCKIARAESYADVIRRILEKERIGASDICSNCGRSFRVQVKGQTRCSECQPTKALRNKIRRISGL